MIPNLNKKTMECYFLVSEQYLEELFKKDLLMDHHF